MACAPAHALRRTGWPWSWRNLQPVHRGGENIAAMTVIAEHVETRAGRRQQHGIAGLGSALRGHYRLFHRCDDARGAYSLECGGDGRRILADQESDSHLAAKHRGERSEVLALSLTP